MSKHDLSVTVDQAMVEQLKSQGALHAGLGYAFQRLGGIDRLVEWADKDDQNLSKFFTLLFKAQPNLIPVQAQQGDVKVHVHPALINNPVRGTTEVVDGEYVEDRTKPVDHE